MTLGLYGIPATLVREYRARDLRYIEANSARSYYRIGFAAL